ncbi:hypothetical protein ES703_31110 [subsurface metagenome]
MKGLLDYCCQVIDIHNQVVMFGNGQCYTGNVCFLKGVTADEVPVHLAGYRDYRNRVKKGIGNAGDQVGRSRTGCGKAYSHLSRRPCIAVSSMCCSLLMAYQNVPELRILRQGVIQRNDRPAGKAKNNLHSLFYQTLT